VDEERSVVDVVYVDVDVDVDVDEDGVDVNGVDVVEDVDTRLAPPCLYAGF